MTTDKVRAQGKAAIGLLAAGVLNGLTALVVAIAGLSNSNAFNLGVQEGIIGVFMLVAAGFIILGAVNLMKVRSSGLALTGAILAVVPCCSPCLLISVPMGIWAMVAINDPAVKSVFGQPDS